MASSLRSRIIQLRFLRFVFFGRKKKMEKVTPVYSLSALLERASDTSDAFHDFRDGHWVAVNWQTLVTDVTSIAHSFAGHGLARGSRIALLGSGSGWMKTYLGAQAAGLIPVGVYDSSSVEEVRELVKDSGAQMLFVSRSLMKDFHVAVPIYLFPDLSTVHPEFGARAWESFLLWNNDLASVKVSVAKIEEDDAASIIYTSGTTGVSKGVVLTFRNIDTFLRSRACSVHSEQTRALSFLPLAHLAGQAWTIWILIAFGGQAWFSRGLPFLVSDLRECRPTTFFAPPRVYEGWFREYEMCSDATIVKAELGLDFCSDMICAAAPFDAKTLAWFHKAGFFVREVYGLSEVPIATSSAGIPFKVGSVGMAEEQVNASKFSKTFFFFVLFFLLRPDISLCERGRRSLDSGPYGIFSVLGKRGRDAAGFYW